MIVIAGKATIKPEYWDEAMQQAQQMSAQSASEPGCHSYRFYVEPTDRNTFFIFEQWDNAEALLQHFHSAHFQAFGAYLQSILTSNMDIKRYEVSSVSDL
ncbi:hypothetical protein KDA_64250 [Dictyobacter alpinus]|uniref:ABM domain-containing protein n=1 Tax=Dictyobacter alpinus TaxID=2014873 RepID=A0A402BHQ0_9CHLR|nr:putative quinol monooxygenase [Dictyobacter alpinus]GCE30941.1 hypothetical protein KDA_64250 [Dictyobacter alpinus]